jgi:uncharacterized membrane protein
MDDKASAQGISHGLVHRLPAISTETLRAVAALEAQLEPVIGVRQVVPAHVIHNVNKLEDEQLSLGDRIADWFAGVVGSWRFIIVQTLLLTAWITLNIVGWFQHWDPFPFILLNLALSFQAAYTAPIIMMSQNRETLKDRIRAEEDYLLSKIAEDEIRAVIAHLERQEQLLLHVLERVERSQNLEPQQGTS